jgi:hypothetical protein
MIIVFLIPMQILRALFCGQAYAESGGRGCSRDEHRVRVDGQTNRGLGSSRRRGSILSVLRGEMFKVQGCCEAW